VLELPLQATSAVIVKGAFHRLALLLHPDKNAAPDAQKAFIRLSEAHEVLRDAGEQRDLLTKLQPQRRKGGGGSKGDGLDDATAAWTSFSFVRPSGTTSSSSSSSTSSTKPKSSSSSSSSRSFMDVLREWEDFEREYMECLRGKETSVETQARKEKRRSRREDVEERQAAERRILLAHLMESVRDDEEEEVGKGGKQGGKEEGEVEEEPTPKRKGNTWQDFLKGKKRKQGGGRGGGDGAKKREK
jgi:DnaJ-class molecular chaperone